MKCNESYQFCSFEHLDTTVTSGPSSQRLFKIYRPLPSSENKLTPKMFFKDFSSLLEHVIIHPGRVLMVGDFNFHVNDPSDHDATTFLDLLDSSGFEQHVYNATGTHKCGNTLDLVISRKTDNLVGNVNVLNGMPSDHKVVKCYLDVSRPPPVKIQVQSRKLRNIDVAKFAKDVSDSLLQVDSNESLSQSVDHYETVLRDLLDTYAPMQQRNIILRPNTPWYSEDLREAKQLKRRLERKMVKSGLDHG